MNRLPLDPLPPRMVKPRPTPADSDDGVDDSLILWMLSLSPAERLDVAQGFINSFHAFPLESPDEDDASRSSR